MLKLIVGLANFEMKYFKTRHNVGAWYIKELMKYTHLLYLKKETRFSGYIGKIIFNDTVVRLFIPNSYMNRSGMSVLSVVNFYQLFLDEILIVHDELDLSPGCVKFQFSKNHNGHNGVKNIIDSFGKKNGFYRLRIGIGRPKSKYLVSKFVLSEPLLEEREMIHKAIIKSVNYTGLVISRNLSQFMQCINLY